MTTTKTFPELEGHTFVSVETRRSYEDDELVWLRDDGKAFKFFHRQDCCESVNIDDICGDLNDLVGTPILSAEETENTVNEEGEEQWTFYRFVTNRGTVVVKWHGTSNGYYSMGVDFEETKP